MNESQIKLYPYQQLVLEALEKEKFVTVSMPRQAGKSQLAWFLATQCDEYERVGIWVTKPMHKSLLSIFFGASCNKLPVFDLSSNFRGQGNSFDLAIVDNADQLDNKTFDEVIRPTVSSGRILLLSTLKDKWGLDTIHVLLGEVLYDKRSRFLETGNSGELIYEKYVEGCVNEVRGIK